MRWDRSARSDAATPQKVVEACRVSSVVVEFLDEGYERVPVAAASVRPEVHNPTRPLDELIRRALHNTVDRPA
jgi:hypothetical protein